MDTKQVVTQQYFGVDQIERMAVAFAKSGLFGIKTPEQGVALMLIAQAEGMHPAIAARDYHVIQGRPALKADAMLARFQAAGGKVVWNAYTDSAVSGTFSHPAGGSATVEWTIQQAKAAGLTSKDVWRQYPRAMLRARVISEGIRTVYPGVSVGVYTPEELQDMDSKPVIKEVQSEPVLVQEPKLEKPKADRDSLMKRLAACTWAREDLKYYCGVAFGVQASKDLTIEQLEQFVTTVESMDMPTAVSQYTDDKL
jgi:hypothetical protein